MKKVKLRFITIFSLMAICFLTLCLAFGALVAPTYAMAATEYNPDAVIVAGTNGKVESSEALSDGNSYVQLTLDNEGKAHFRHDLALKWYAEKASDGEEAAKDNEVGATPEGEAKYFTMDFAFKEVNFETFTITFVSAEENVSKEGKSTNAVVFTKDGSTLRAAVKVGEADAGEAVTVSNDATADITLTFNQNGDQANAGAFDVIVNNITVGEFKNIGGYYLEYSTSRDPMTFEAVGGDLALTSNAKQQIVYVKSINGQTMKLTDGKVADDTAPVLIVNEVVSMFPLGQKFSLTCRLIDVLADSKSTTSITTQYYQYRAKEGEETEKKAEYGSLSTSTFFLPSSEESTEEYVSVRFRLNDNRTLPSGESWGYAYLTWYMEETDVVTDKGDGVSYIRVNRNNNPPQYTTIVNDTENKTSKPTANAEALVAEYQALVDEASKELNAGDGAYFYLPSLRSLIDDDDTDYRNLKFNVYYKDQSSDTTHSATALAYNALRFEIEKKGNYSFRVVASDKLGNVMQLYNNDGNLVSVTSSNVWDFDCLPQFTFTANSTGAFIEEPKEPSQGYVDGTYSVNKFEIVAVTGYETEYTLYYFDLDEYKTKNNGVSPSFADIRKNPEQYLDSDCVTVIREYDSSISETDEAWDQTDNDYAWRPSALTFRPQQAGCYIVKVEVTDYDFWQDKQSAYQVIEVTNRIDTIPAQMTDWLENNKTAVILFSISAVLAVAIVVLFFVNPSDKKVEEVDVSKLKGSKKEKKEKKDPSEKE